MIYQIRIIPVVKMLNGLTGWTLRAETLEGENFEGEPQVFYWSFDRVYEASMEGLDQARAMVLHTAKQGRGAIRRSNGWDTDFRLHVAELRWEKEGFWAWVERNI